MANSFSLSTSGAVPALGSGIGSRSGIQLNSNVKKAASATGGFLGGLGSSNPASIASPAQQSSYGNFTRNVPTVSGLLPSTPVKSVTTPDGHVTTFHAPATDSVAKSSSSSATSTPKTYSGYIAPSQVNTGTAENPNIQTSNGNNASSQNSYTQPTQTGTSNPNVTRVNPDGTPISQANAYQNSGVQTQNEQVAQKNLIQSGEMTDKEKVDSQRAEDLYNTQSRGQLAGYSDASMYNVNDPNSRPDLNAPDFYQQKASDQSLYNNLSGIGYAGAQQALAYDASVGNRRVTAAQGAYSGSQTQAQRAAQAQKDIFSASLPQQVSPTNVPYNPLTGTYGSPASTAYGNGGLAGVGALQQQQNQGADVQTMTSALNQTSGLINKAKQDIASSGFNAAPIPLANALQQWLNTGVVANPQYTNVINDLTEIASTIAPVLGTPGNPSDLKTTLSQELIPRLMQGQDIGTALDNIEKNAGIKIDAARNSATNNAVTNPQSNSSSLSAWGWNG